MPKKVYTKFKAIQAEDKGFILNDVIGIGKV